MHNLPWWLEAGPASCAVCAAAYHEELACYCIDCDQPICPVCIVEMRETRAIFCPECAP